METLLSIFLLVVFGVIANFISAFVLNIAGLPGALLAGTPGKRSKSQFILSSIVAAVGQSYVYLAYEAFIVNWTVLAVEREGVLGFLIWPVAFFAAFLPMWVNLIRARLEDRESKHANPQVEALHITTFIAFVGFFVFSFIPSVMRFGWGWLPYLK